MIYQREDRWVLSLPSLPCSGSKSGIHVSRGFVLSGVMGASLGRRPGQDAGSQGRRGSLGPNRDPLSYYPPALSLGLVGHLI